MAEHRDASGDFEKALSKNDRESYLLRLYVAGTTPRSMQAITNLKKICDEYLKGYCDLEIIDIYQKPDMARKDQIVAMPTLVKKLPPPLKRIIGDLSNKDKVLVGLDLIEKEQGMSNE